MRTKSQTALQKRILTEHQKDPQATQREIAVRVGASERTVGDVLRSHGVTRNKNAAAAAAVAVPDGARPAIDEAVASDSKRARIPVFEPGSSYDERAECLKRRLDIASDRSAHPDDLAQLFAVK